MHFFNTVFVLLFNIYRWLVYFKKSTAHSSPEIKTWNLLSFGLAPENPKRSSSAFAKQEASMLLWGQLLDATSIGKLAI